MKLSWEILKCFPTIEPVYFLIFFGQLDVLFNFLDFFLVKVICKTEHWNDVYDIVQLLQVFYLILRNFFVCKKIEQQMDLFNLRFGLTFPSPIPQNSLASFFSSRLPSNEISV